MELIATGHLYFAVVNVLGFMGWLKLKIGIQCLFGIWHWVCRVTGLSLRSLDPLGCLILWDP